MRALVSFRFLRALSFTNSAVFTALLFCWLSPGMETGEAIFGWTHGCMWIALSLLCLVGVRRRTIPFWLAVVVAVIGGLGPFAGSFAFAVESRRKGRSASGFPRAAQPETPR